MAEEPLTKQSCQQRSPEALRAARLSLLEQVGIAARIAAPGIPAGAISFRKSFA